MKRLNPHECYIHRILIRSMNLYIKYILNYWYLRRYWFYATRKSRKLSRQAYVLLYRLIKTYKDIHDITDFMQYKNQESRATKRIVSTKEKYKI